MNGTEEYYTTRIQPREEGSGDVALLTFDPNSFEVLKNGATVAYVSERNVDQAMTNDTICTWTTSTGTAFSESSGTFTCNEAGLYHFLATVNLISTSGTFYCRFVLVVNGVEYADPVWVNSNTMSRVCMLATARTLQVGDEFHFAFVREPSSAFTATSQSALLYVHRL